MDCYCYSDCSCSEDVDQCEAILHWCKCVEVGGRRCRGANNHFCTCAYRIDSCRSDFHDCQCVKNYIGCKSVEHNCICSTWNPEVCRRTIKLHSCCCIMNRELCKAIDHHCSCIMNHIVFLMSMIVFV